MRAFFLFLLFLSVTVTSAQNISFSAGVGITTANSVYPFPNSTDLIERNLSREFEGGVSYNFNFTYSFSAEYFAALQGEFISLTNPGSITALQGSATVNIQTKELIKIFPIEITAGYILPFSDDTYSMSIYSGAGIYPALYKREAGTLVSTSVADNNSVNLVAGIVATLHLYNKLNAMFDIRFRDPDIYFNNTYSSSVFNLSGKEYSVKNLKFNSRANLNGIQLVLGLKYGV